MDALGNFLTELPMPLGPIVTGLLPVAAIGGFVAAVWAYRQGRSALVAVAVLVALVGIVGMAAFLTAT